jgi:hypothetical protein
LAVPDSLPEGTEVEHIVEDIVAADKVVDTVIEVAEHTGRMAAHSWSAAWA